MSWLYRTVVRPVLFAQDSEAIHNLTINALGRISKAPLACEALGTFFEASRLPVRLWGYTFPNPVGLAAGMDKEAEALPAWESLGFGFAELGAVTWHPQPGNSPPRVFRAIEDEALVNRMGFNNGGAEMMATKLATWKAEGRYPQHPVGMNLGKSKITPLDKAPDDYAKSFEVLWPYLDFFVVNVSSPNTPNLRHLQDKTALDEILVAMQAVNRRLANQHSTSDGPAFQPKPILIKIAPDLTFEAIDDILSLVQPRAIAGIVATNTTIGRPAATDEHLRKIYSEAGGLSGKPLRLRSTEVVRFLSRRTQGNLPIIGVGGIFTAEDAWEKVTAGARLVQIYTGLVYEGPGIAKKIVDGLQQKLEGLGLTCLEQAVGLDHH